MNEKASSPLRCTCDADELQYRHGPLLRARTVFSQTKYCLSIPCHHNSVYWPRRVEPLRRLQIYMAVDLQELALSQHRLLSDNAPTRQGKQYFREELLAAH